MRLMISRLLPAAFALAVLVLLAWPAGGRALAGGGRPAYAGTDSFWMDMDAAARAQPVDLGKRAAWLSKSLAARGQWSVVDWHRAHLGHVVEANTWGLRDASRLMHSDMDREGFYHFRGWLAGQGQQRFAGAVRDADDMAAWVDKAEGKRNGYQWAALDSVAWHALELLEFGPESTEEMLALVREEVMTEENAKPTGKVLEEYEVAGAYPRLWAMFGR